MHYENPFKFLFMVNYNSRDELTILHIDFIIPKISHAHKYLRNESICICFNFIQDLRLCNTIPMVSNKTAYDGV